MTASSFLLETLSAARDLGRLHEIASVLVRHGLGDAVERLGITKALERAGRALHLPVRSNDTHRRTEERVRLVLEELGPSFVKVGQILAGRRDLLPPEWTEELARLRQSVPPVPIEEIRAQLTEDYGAPPEEVFAEFDPEPLAAASIAQVHRARLVDGTPVAVKVRRPGIREVVEADMRLLARFAELAEEGLPELQRYRPTSLARQLARSLRRELDLRVEGRSARRMRDALADQPGLAVPLVHAAWTHERVCVMELFEGPSIGEWLARGESTVHERQDAARIGAEAVLEMVFVHGFFHADPHPGNVIVLGDGRLGLIDFGMVGSLSDARRIEFLELLAAFATRDDEAVVDQLLEWSEDGKTDGRALSADVTAFLDQYADLPVGELDATTLLVDLTRILREDGLFLPDDVALLLKVFLTLDGLGKELDPGFVTSAHVAPFARRALSAHWAPRAVLSRGRRRASRLLMRVPRTLERVMDHAQRGSLGMEVEVRDLDRFGERISRSANRVSVGLVTSALIVGTSIATTVDAGPRVFGMPVLAFVGFVSSSVAGVWLVTAMIRSRR